ncbi:ABC transporter substrate-binding protein [Mesorhizobium sp.]|uniref:ABC transporter substrate-binding protein n=1 Tax=Mesorhizobium sp. TaxID=1871066 RepID=UPI000FE83B38|nr:ABC transporter substrate-binding protein [Mesorhizobium sp.]RWK42007.1 MAG: extracellular solute-binding protein [Mesorhizobium sp.]RWK71036.1 MAG: extracellular solute-binding protein [Mesorhizobium sp.]RWK78449.1 MAG: extracellular solute-binding protein [Mesorhizobium sp.]RWK84481.1 MAG: extracellular solute-binding protein [Mesorhizobium sp.]RWL05672.1 MAG: extracellular solute-binding protein [Mesorhizobium sp.]
MRKIILAAMLLASAIAGVSAADGKLVVYTSQPNTDAQQTVGAFMAKYPGVKVEWVRDGTPKILAKLRAEIEAGQPQADVLLIADVVTMEGLKKEGRLLAYPEAEVSGIEAALYDKDKTYFSTKLITTGIVYNTKAPFVPASWEDLTRPEAKGLVAMPSPLTSGAAMIHTVTLTGNLPQGWNYYDALARNGAQASGGNGDVLKAVSGGDKLFGMIVDYMPLREKAKGAPIEFVFPREGVSAVTEPVAILSTARNADAAKAFVDFLLSKDGQQAAAKMGYIPARADIALPAGYPDRSSIKVLGYDAAAALANDAANKEKFGAVMSQ